MIGRKVRGMWSGDEGEVLRWEPLGVGLTDVLVQTSRGPVWVSSTDLKPTDGLGPLPNRRGLR